MLKLNNVLGIYDVDTCTVHRTQLVGMSTACITHKLTSYVAYSNMMSNMLLPRPDVEQS